jgi:hypothetical protein
MDSRQTSRNQDAIALDIILEVSFTGTLTTFSMIYLDYYITNKQVKQYLHHSILVLWCGQLYYCSCRRSTT